MLSPIRRLGPAVLLILVAGLVLASCGGGGSDEDVENLLDRAFRQSVRSGDLKLDAQLELKGVRGLDDPIRLRASGPFRNVKGKLPATNLTIQIGAAGQNIETGFASTGDRAFVKFQDVFYEQPRADVARTNRQIARRGQRRGSLRALGLDPRGWLAESSKEGDEEVAGVETQHVSGTLDVAKVVEDFNDFVRRSGDALGGATGQAAPRPLSRENIEQLKEIVEDPSFDVYVGKDDGIIRRLSARLEFDVPEDQRQGIGGLEGGTLSLSVEFAKVNGRQRIEAPANARPLADLTRALGAGGLGGLGSGSGSGSGGSSAGSEQFDKYAECLDDAEPNDTDALQRCSELLR